MKNTPATISDELIDGWLPAAWMTPGDEAKAKRTRARADAGLKKKDPRLKRFRTLYQQIVAITAADCKGGRPFSLPFSLDKQNLLEGELYFLILCQTLYREASCKAVLDEPMRGEDLIRRLIYWWAQGPLFPSNLRAAMQGSSLDLGEDDD